MQRKNLTQQEIAKRLNVSPTAVSLTLKDPQTPRVSVERRQSILDFVKEHAPRLYPSVSRNRIVLSLPDINAYSGPVYGAITAGVQDACRSRNWKLDIQMGSSADSKELLLGPSYPSGLIAVVGRSPFTNRREIGKSIPVVLVNGQAFGDDCDVVDLDNRAGVELLLQLLYDEGHRNFVFLHDHNGEDRFRHHLRQRTEAFFGFCIAQKICFSEKDFINVGDYGPTGEAPAYDATLNKILSLPRRPTAVVCFNDFIAAQFTHAVHRRGLSVPGDFSITGYDDHAMALQTAPRITTIKHDRSELGRTAVDVLAFRIERPKSPKLRIIAPPQLVSRESHGTPGQF